jgi:excisionase family DNA binding protein
MDPIFISVEEAASALSMGRSYIYTLLKNGDLDSCKVGRRRLISVDSIRRLASEKNFKSIGLC